MYYKMGEYTLVKIVKSDKPGYKLKAVFRNKKTGKENTEHFGKAGMSDYTKHKDKKRRERYRNRHKSDLETNDPTRAGYLSYYILWGDSTSLRTNIAAYKRRFFPGSVSPKKKVSSPKKKMYSWKKNASPKKKMYSWKKNASPKPTRKTGLKRWFAEEWVTASGKECGDPSEKVKKCRPKKRITDKTPVTWNEMTPAQRKRVDSEKKKVGMGRRASSIKRKKTKISSPDEPEPANPALYARIKSRVKKRVKASGKTWPSAYASAELVRKYKKAGGTYR